MTDLEKLLRDDARAGLPDDGFTARVLAALPARAPARSPWRDAVLVIGAATLGSVLAFWLAPGEHSLLQGFADLARLRPLTTEALLGLGMAGALLLSALVLAVEPD